jgi:peptidyl-prolyl cis-trans isomerase SurA
VLVNTELLRQAAAAAGIAVTPEQIDARYAEIMTGLGGEAQLQTKMAELGITPESLRTDIEGEILIQTHLTAAVDVSTIVIDPKEVLAVYEQANTAEAKLPPFEQVKPDIESQLRFTKEQELVNAYIQSLRDTAEIKTNI